MWSTRLRRDGAGNGTHAVGPEILMEETDMRSATRTEVDLLGSREVPLDAYWGIHTLRAMENFQISGTTIGDVPELVRGMVQVKKASALANSELGTLPPELAEAILWACD